MKRAIVPALSGAPRDLAKDYGLAPFLTADETADLLRTSRKGVYALIERGQLPGVTRVGRRVLVSRDDLLQWLLQKRAPSPKE